MKWIKKINYALPIIGAIHGFSFPDAVYIIVEKRKYSCTTTGEGYYNYTGVLSSDIKFFGYKEQCEKHLSEFDGCFIIEGLQNIYNR